MHEPLIRIKYAKRFSVLNACKFSFRSSLKSRLIAFPILHKTKSSLKSTFEHSEKKINNHTFNETKIIRKTHIRKARQYLN